MAGKITTKHPRVALFFQNDIPLERAKMKGIMQYLRRRPQWDIPLIGRRPGVTYEQLREWRGDGVIGNIPPEVSVDALQKRGVKIVNTASPRENNPRIHIVSVDSAKIGFLAAEHLLQRKFHRFAFAGTAANEEGKPLHFQKRQKGFMDTIRSYGFPCREFWVTSPCVEDFLESEMWLPYIKTLTLPVAIFACSDYVGYGILRACRELELRVPEELAVLGVDNDDILCQLAIPRLSSIDPNGEKVGYLAAATLDRLMQGDTHVPPLQYVAPQGIRMWTSTNIFASSDLEVTEAIRFIHSHAQDPITVKEVMRIATVSRRTLERRFRELMSQSIAEYLRNTRLDMVIELLADHHRPIEEIARRCGFDNAPRLNTAFRKKYGCTAAAYRDRLDAKPNVD